MTDTCSTPVVNKQITIEQRLDILSKLEAGVNVSALAHEYSVTERSIRRIRQKALSIRQYAEDTKDLSRKRIRTSAFNDLENQLYSWSLQRRLLGDSVTNTVLLEKVKELQHENGGPSNFTPSRGWLWRFKKSCHQRLINNYGENADANKCAAERFIEQFPQILEDAEISDDNLYNMDETSLFWRMLPTKTLMSSSEKGIKKDRITLGLCANASGNHKLPPVFINNRENPRALKHCKSNLPVIYKYHKNSWMTTAMFLSWYENEFKSSVRNRQLEENRHGKVLLILDNFSGHKISDEQMDDAHFKIMFLPPNTSSLIQPMDQGIISKCKRLFRHKLLQWVLKYNGGISDFYADYDVKDCIDLVHKSWSNVTAMNIFNAWNKIFNRETRLIHPVTFSSETGSINAECKTISDEEVNEWINKCQEVEIIREDDTEEEEESSHLHLPLSIEGEEIDRLLHHLAKIQLTESEIANHAQSIIRYYSTK